MPHPPILTPARLEPPGPYVTPAVAAFHMALGYPAEEGLPMRLCFVLPNGVELHVPATPQIACEIRDKLTEAFPPETASSEEYE